MTTERIGTYAPNQVDVIIFQESSGLSWRASGFMEDSIVSVEPSAATFTRYKGADNTGARIYNADDGGKVTMSLQQISITNDVLEGLFANDRASRNGLFGIMVKDKSGRTSFFSEEAYIAQRPTASFSNSMQAREWIIECDHMVSFVGGNAPISAAAKAALEQLGVQLDPKWTA